MTNRVFTTLIVLLVSLSWSTIVRGQLQPGGPLGYFSVPTLPQEVARVHQIPIDTGSIPAPKDTLFQQLSATGNPVSYYRKIMTEVCFDSSCRLLRVNLYWNVTGRYLGFELPPGEFLSKAEHEPFDTSEYLRLHAILADSLSPLGNLTYQALVPKNNVGSVLDGITGPTSKDVLQYVVKGAVFTTYTTWRLTYGKTRAAVIKATEQAIDGEYLLAVLNSEDLWDRHWALDRLDRLPTAPTEVKDRLVDLMCGDAYNLAAHAIRAVPPSWCADTVFQQALWSAFDCVQYALQPALLKKIGLLDPIDDSILLAIADRLPRMNGPVLTAALECLRKSLPDNDAVLERLIPLRNHENRFVANQVKKILSGVAVASQD